MGTPNRGWIEDRNRFGLAKPPDYFLQRLLDYDNMLVVIPSRQQALYRLARRVQFTPGIGALAVLSREADTAMMHTHGLVPVTTIVRFGGSNFWDAESVIQKLKDRDIWEHGGAEKVAELMDAAEAADRQRLLESTRDNMRQRAKDGWNSLQARTGSRNKTAYDGNIHAHSRRSRPTMIRVAGKATN